MRVYKYVVPMPNDYYESEVRMPLKARILSVGMQKDQIVVWANIPNSVLERNENLLSTRKLYVVNTGGDYAKSSLLKYIKFIGTVTSSNGIVWHIFEDDNKEW